MRLRDQCPRCWRIAERSELCFTCKAIQRGEDAGLKQNRNVRPPLSWEEHRFVNRQLGEPFPPFVPPTEQAISKAASDIALRQFHALALPAMKYTTDPWGSNCRWWR